MRSQQWLLINNVYKWLQSQGQSQNSAKYSLIRYLHYDLRAVDIFQPSYETVMEDRLKELFGHYIQMMNDLAVVKV